MDRFLIRCFYYFTSALYQTQRGGGGVGVGRGGVGEVSIRSPCFQCPVSGLCFLKSGLSFQHRESLNHLPVEDKFVDYVQ